MIDLLLQIVFASTFTLFIKLAQVRGRDDVITIGAINYIAAAICIIPFFAPLSQTRFPIEAVWTGSVMGAIYFVTYFFVIYCVKKVGASGATTVGVLSILLPIGFATVMWNQRPNLIQSIGIVLALLALTLIGGHTNRLDKDDEPDAAKWIVPTVLFLYFLLCGFIRLAQDTFGHVCQPVYRPTFIFTTFLVTAFPSIGLLIFRRRKILTMEIVFGILMGVSNVLQTHYILRALEHTEGFIVFPVTSAGCIVLTTLVATRLLGEQLNRRTYFGIAISVVALFLLYWIPN